MTAPAHSKHQPAWPCSICRFALGSHEALARHTRDAHGLHVGIPPDRQPGRHYLFETGGWR